MLLHIKWIKQYAMDTKDYNDERIKYTVQEIGYYPVMMDTILRKTINKTRKNSIKLNSNTQQQEKYYNDKSQNSSTFRKVKYKMSCKMKNTMRKHFNLNSNLHKRNNDENNKGGVYKLKYSDCSRFYIGQTDRSTLHEIRLCREHNTIT